MHGSTKEGRDIEIQCIKRKVHMFIEKPLSCAPVEEVEKVNTAILEASKNGVIASVGYMFRYRFHRFFRLKENSKAVLKMKELIKQHGEPKAFNARYLCAYSTIKKDMESFSDFM